MTDLQRHLKIIRKRINRALDEVGRGNALDLDALRAQIRADLSSGYGVTNGRIEGVNGTFPLILYDVPQVGVIPLNRPVPIDGLLFVADIAAEYDTAGFAAALERIAAIKAQRHSTSTPTRQPIERIRGAPLERRKLPKTRLPYSLIAFERFTDAESTIGLCLRIGDTVHRYPNAHQSDEIIVTGQHLRYLHPEIEGNAPTWSDIGVSVMPDHARTGGCYICKGEVQRRHFFYDALCVRCGDLNYRKRIAAGAGDLTGRFALVTGARVKIGYAAALRLLRAGAFVIATSRFPRDTARRYAQEPDFEVWRDRIRVYGLDMRQLGRVEAFIDHLYNRYPYLDILINNAAQTIKRPPMYYAHLRPLETLPLNALPHHVPRLFGEGEWGEPTNVSLDLPMLPVMEDDPDFPRDQYDEDGQQIDNRRSHSWVMRLDEISAAEMLEVQIINAVAPAVLAGQLKGLMMRSPHPIRHIINVSAAEGRFAAFKLDGMHPHTNMAKAALNMLTRSIAAPYAELGIYVNSVDPGWVSDQMPRGSDERRSAFVERLPLDLIDAAARVCDPIFTDDPPVGSMLKDYRVVAW